jgi:type IV pilus assembly protein PilC
LESFTYKGRDRTGRRINGNILAKDLKDAENKLKTMGVKISSCRKGAVAPKWNLIKKDSKGNLSLNLKPPSVSAKEIAVFTKQLSVMINSGLSVVQSLEMLTDQTDNVYLREVLQGIKTSVESGSDLGPAMTKYPNVFSSLYVAMVDSGTESGQLDDMLKRLSIYVEKNNRLISQLKSAMTYPILVVVLSIGLTALMLTLVVPAFASSFEEAGQELPALTQLVVDASDFTRDNLIKIVIIFVVVFQVFLKWKKTPIGTKMWDQFLLKLPIFGTLILKISIARFSRTLGTLSGSGISILDALNTCAKASGNVIIESGIMKIRDDTEKGKGIADPMRQFPELFPLLVTGMIEIGEASGQLDTMLAKIADFYEEEVDDAVAGALKMVEPLMFVVIGGIVGVILIAMYLPIFSMASNF